MTDNRQIGLNDGNYTENLQGDFVHGDKIQNIFLPEKHKDYDSIFRLLNEEEFNNTSLRTEDSSKNNAERFIYLLRNYSADESPRDKKNSIEEIIKLAWDQIVYEKKLKLGKIKEIIEIIQNLNPNAKELESIILPIVKYQGEKKLIEYELINFFRFNPDDKIDKFQIKGYLFLLKKILLRLLYDQNEIFENALIKKEIENLFTYCSNDIEPEFWLDVYLRYKCNSFNLPEYLSNQIENIKNNYFENNPGSPISLLYEYIVDPIKTTIDNQKDINLVFQKTLEDCQNFVEYKWYVAAILRFFPIVNRFSEKKENEKQKIADYLITIQRDSDKNSRQAKYNLTHSSTFKVIYLRVLSKAFADSLKVEYLEIFHDIFKKNKKLIPESECLALELEFNCCLYLYNELPINNNDTEKAKINDLFLELENNNYNYNKAKIDDYRAEKEKSKQIRNQRKQVLNKEIAKKYENLRIYVSENHLFLKKLPILLSSNIEKINQLLPKDIVKSLEKFRPSKLKDAESNSFHLDFSFYAKSTFVTNKIDRKVNFDLIQEYLSYAVKADHYSLICNANSIARDLYSCFYYKDEESENKITEKQLNNRHLLLEFVSEIEKLTINYPQLKQQLFWLYLKCIKWEEKDKNFLYEIIHQLKQLKQLKQVNNRTIWSTTVQQYIVKHENQTELVKTLLSNVNSSECWNLIGTTINNQPNKLSQDYDFAAFCYKQAITFDTQTNSFQEKYFYNYIRTQKDYFYKITEENLIAENFISEVAEYAEYTIKKLISIKKHNLPTRYKKCLSSFFVILQDHFNSLDNYFNNRYNMHKNNFRFSDFNIFNNPVIRKELKSPDFQKLYSQLDELNRNY